MKEKTIYEELSEERKLLQEQERLPEWCTTAAWQLLKEKYLTAEYPDLKSAYTRISNHAAKYTDDQEYWAPKFYDLLWKGWMSASTPILSNMGTGYGCPVSCSGQYIDDSIHGFYSSQLETAILSKNGYGTSGYLGDIRPRGSKISGIKGGASGVLPVFKDFVQLSRDVSQGSQRRGAWAGYIEIDHDDFYELVTYIAKNPDDANIGWIISDEFIERLENGDQDAINRYQESLKLKMITGKGYYFFVDKVNRLNPQMYKDKGLKVQASNLCLTGDTIIEIKDHIGISNIRLDDFVEKYQNGEYHTVEVKSFDGSNIKFSQVSAAAKTAIVDELYEIETPSGKIIRCTANHKIYTKNRGYVEAQDLVETDELLEDNLNQPIDTSENLLKIWIIDVESTPVYDITVPETDCFFANNILVHNCSEISLYSDNDYTYSCVLSSMNVAKYDEWKDTDAVFTATVFLDCVNQDQIEIGRKIPGMEKIVRFAEESRALGLGVLGFHTYLQDNLIPFESFDAHMKNLEIFQHLDQESLRASQWMAQQWGEPEWCKGYGVRNTHRSSTAPTLSTSLICGSVSQGIEPIYKNAYVQNTAGGKLNRVNPSLLRIMKERDVYSDENISDIVTNNGSVQHVDWLSEHEKSVFKTAFEIDQMAIIRLASTRQKFIDQAQSINLFFSADENEEYISEVHKKAFLDPYIKSLYYIRSENGVQVSKNECVACHA